MQFFLTSIYGFYVSAFFFAMLSVNALISSDLGPRRSAKATKWRYLAL